MRKVGIIGPENSVAFVHRICTEEELFQPTSIPYKKIEDCTEIIKENKFNVSYWLFTGPAPYYYCLQEKLISKENSTYPPLSGEGLMSTLFKVYRTNDSITRIGFDVFLKSEIEESLSSLDLELDHYDTIGYQGYLNNQKIIDHHIDNLTQNRVELIVTCLSSVEQHLKKEGFPVRKVTLPNPVIRKTCYELAHRIKTKKLQLSSIAIVAIELDSETMNKDPLSYTSRKNHSQLNYYLFDLSEKFSGALCTYSDTLHLLITTSGEVDECIRKHNLYDFLNNLMVMHDIRARIGIGFGLNVHLAIRNVQKSLSRAKKSSDSSIFKVHEDGSIHGPMQFSLHDSRKCEKHTEGHISNNVIKRVEAISRQYGIKEITSIDLASWLKVTERNARRILTEMEQAGLAKHTVAQEKRTKGRPRKVYTLFS